MKKVYALTGAALLALLACALVACGDTPAGHSDATPVSDAVFYTMWPPSDSELAHFNPTYYTVNLLSNSVAQPMQLALAENVAWFAKQTEKQTTWFVVLNELALEVDSTRANVRAEVEGVVAQAGAKFRSEGEGGALASSDWRWVVMLAPDQPYHPALYLSTSFPLVEALESYASRQDLFVSTVLATSVLMPQLDF